MEHVSILLLKRIVLLIVVIFLEVELTIIAFARAQFLRRFVLPVYYLAALLIFFIFILVGTFLDCRTAVLRVIDVWEVRPIYLVLLLVEVEPPRHSLVAGPAKRLLSCLVWRFRNGAAIATMTHLLGLPGARARRLTENVAGHRLADRRLLVHTHHYARADAPFLVRLYEKRVEIF